MPSVADLGVATPAVHQFGAIRVHDERVLGRRPLDAVDRLALNRPRLSIEFDRQRRPNRSGKLESDKPPTYGQTLLLTG